MGKSTLDPQFIFPSNLNTQYLCILDTSDCMKRIHGGFLFFSHPSRHLIYQLIGLRNEDPEAINFDINEVIEYGIGHIMLYNKEKAVFGKGKMRSIRICSKYVK